MPPTPPPGCRIADYQIERTLGTGATGTVYKALCTAGRLRRRTVAVKVVRKETLVDQGRLARIREEIAVHARLDRHRNILQYEDAFEDDTAIYILTEFCSGSTVFRYMMDNAPTGLPECDVRPMMRDLTEAVAFLHDRGVVHRDLKLTNLLLDDDRRVKIADFGLATTLPLGERLADAVMCGTPNYVSPEVLARASYGPSSDCWSLGCVLVALLTGKPPFQGSQVGETLHLVSRGAYRPLPRTCSRKAKSLVHALLQVDPDVRPTAEQVLRHPFLCRGAGYDGQPDSGREVVAILRPEEQVSPSLATSKAQRVLGLQADKAFATQKEQVAVSQSNRLLGQGQDVLHGRQDVLEPQVPLLGLLAEKVLALQSESALDPQTEKVLDPGPEVLVRRQDVLESRMQNVLGHEDQEAFEVRTATVLHSQTPQVPQPGNQRDVLRTEDKSPPPVQADDAFVAKHRFTTDGLQASEHKTKRGTLTVIDDGWARVRLVEDTTEQQISPDGGTIRVGEATYTLADLPARLMPGYRYAAKIVHQLKGRLVRVALESDGAKCRLFGDGKFECALAKESRKVSYDRDAIKVADKQASLWKGHIDEVPDEHRDVVRQAMIWLGRSKDISGGQSKDVGGGFQGQSNRDALPRKSFTRKFLQGIGWVEQVNDASDGRNVWRFLFMDGVSLELCAKERRVTIDDGTIEQYPLREDVKLPRDVKARLKLCGQAMKAFL